MKRCVIIPVYTDELNIDEKRSISRTLNVFESEEIVLITYKGLSLPNIDNLLSHHKNNRIEYFGQWYFKNVNRYNQLMLSKGFYDRFRKYDYILICQLDVFIFSNQLDYWCNQGFDYVGAPLFNHNSKDFGGCYNGGFSLRRISAFRDKYDSYGKWKRFLCKPSSFSVFFFFKYLFSLVTYYNIRLQIPKTSSGEDLIWSRLEKVPSFEKSAHFSFEKYPSYLHSIIKKLPFGCHAYLKWDDGFYKKYINEIVH